jgi:demethylmenaquinone methyltransferase/2-methoxy-6-polyprenyl-1,4-benzoquinol methylase/phosphoethanolamine N-methyltransferase
MHGHNKHSNVIQHILIFAVVGIILFGIYLYFENTTTTALSGIGLVLLILAHVLVFGGVAYIGLRKLQSLHSPHNHSHAGHSHDGLQTEGGVIRWAFWYDVLVSKLMPGDDKQFRAEIVKLANIQPNEKVLDVGCGPGTLAVMAKLKSDPSVKVYGTDAAVEMIERAKQKAQQAGAEVEFKAGLAEALDYPDNTFDVVMNSLFVHHMPGDLKMKAFAEMYRILKPNGRLLVIEFEPPKRGLSKFIYSVILGEMMRIDNSQLPEWIKQAGFTSISTGEVSSGFAIYMLAKKP